MAERLRRLFAKQQDPYAGADIVLARKMGGILASLGGVLVVVLVPFSPLDREIGDAGWLIGAAILIWGGVVVWTTRSGRIDWSFEMFLAAAYAGIAQIALLQWLAGGFSAPYANLLLLPMLFVAATNPARRVLALLLAIAVALALPLAYNGWSGDVAASAIATMVLWTALTFVIFTLMSGIRAQRLALRENEAQAREEARVDELTGIGNRRAFEEAIEDEIARATRMKLPLGVALGDIVSFKQVNDEWGHLEGDEALRGVAAAIADELRAPDRVFRWGGDEFALLLPGTATDGGVELAERIQNKVAVVCRRPDDEAIRVRFGVAELHDGMTGTELVESADLALLAEKTRQLAS